MTPTSYTTRTVPTITYGTRGSVTTNYTPRTGVVSDLGYLITQLGTLCNNSGVRILFHTGTFYSSTTPYTTRPII